MTKTHKVKWTCTNCGQEMNDDIDNEEGPVLLLACDRCAHMFDIDNLKPNRRIKWKKKKGPGRPPGRKKGKVSFWLPFKWVRWLRRQKKGGLSQAVLIERALDETYSKGGVVKWIKNEKKNT